MQFNMDKARCFTYSTDPAVIASIHQHLVEPLGVTFFAEGVVYCGAPIGSVVYCTRFLRDLVDKIGRNLKEIEEMCKFSILPDNAPAVRFRKLRRIRRIRAHGHGHGRRRRRKRYGHAGEPGRGLGAHGGVHLRGTDGKQQTNPNAEKGRAQKKRHAKAHRHRLPSTREPACICRSVRGLP